MKSFINESMKIFNTSNNLNKSTNTAKKIKNIKLINEYSQKGIYHKNKINLKSRNYYKYDFNNILNRTNRTNKSRIKKSERNYSSFYSRTTNNFFVCLIHLIVKQKQKNYIKEFFQRKRIILMRELNHQLQIQNLQKREIILLIKLNI